MEKKRNMLETQLFVIIVMELCEQGDLKTKINEKFYSKQQFSKEEYIKIISEILSAFNYLHQHGIVHRDVKPQNIFFTAEGTVKLGDFGLAKKKRHDWVMKTRVGTDCYMSPEVLEDEEYNEKVDD